MVEQEENKDIDLSEVPFWKLLQEIEARDEGDHQNVYAYDDDTKAMIVAESYAITPKESKAKWGVTISTVQAWRRRAKTNKAFGLLVARKQAEYRRDLTDATAAAIRASLDYIKRAAQEAPTDDPKVIRSIAGALKMAGEFGLASEITYSRLGKSVDNLALPAPEADDNDKYDISIAESIVEGDFEDVERLE